jgi:hypothetical protein
MFRVHNIKGAAARRRAQIMDSSLLLGKENADIDFLIATLHVVICEQVRVGQKASVITGSEMTEHTGAMCRLRRTQDTSGDRKRR